MRPGVVAGALLSFACAGGVRFETRLPPELPDISRWETSSGSAELTEPRRTVQYELFVSPKRPSVYSVTRYRVLEHELPSHSYEKLQWDKDGRDVRRYECAPAPTGLGPCRWREYRRGSAEYDGEMGTVMAVYFLHAELLQRRDAAR